MLTMVEFNDPPAVTNHHTTEPILKTGLGLSKCDEKFDA